MPLTARCGVVFLACGPAASHSPALPVSNPRLRAGLFVAIPAARFPRGRSHTAGGLTPGPHSRSIDHVRSVNQQKGNGHEHQHLLPPADRPAGRRPPHRRGRQPPHPVDPRPRRRAGLPGRRPVGPPLRRVPQRRPPR
nr:MAG TPA: hypothetical protein [Caudoviricetes sp.]